MNDYDSIPYNTRNVIDTLIHQDNVKNRITVLWRLFLLLNHNDTNDANEELQIFLNELDTNLTTELMLDVINEKIANIQQEEGIVNFGGLKRRKKGKTGKKRKRGASKTSRKKRKRSKN
jgi:hypothetical protein